MGTDHARAAETWAPSRFNVSVDLPDGRMAVFNSFRVMVIQIHRNTWRKFLSPGAAYPLNGKPPSKTARVLRDKGFLVPRGVDELDLVRIQHLSRRYSQKGLSVYLAPTLACNLQCRYCFEGLAQSLPTRQVMDRRAEDATVRYIATQAQDRQAVGLTWFGGEPLLRLQTIERISGLLIPAFDKAGIQYLAMLQTNGILVGERAVKALKAGRVLSAQVTVDIPKSEKRDRHGRDTLDRALDGAALLAGALEVTLRVNLARDDEAEFDALYEALLRRGLHKRLSLIYFADVRQPECGRERCSGLLARKQYVRVLARERGKAAALGLPTNTLSFITPGGCVATRTSGIAIGPDGLLYKCPEDLGLDDRAYGSVFNDDLDLANLVPWLTHDGLQYEPCRNCPVLPQCGGGCPHKRLFQARELKRDDFCHWLLRVDLPNRIREYVARDGSDRVPALRGEY
jgi:uncharacterized protein